jgi:hypothetical protein
MGGQACVFYGAAEFSRDLDLLVLADAASIETLRSALSDLGAEQIAVPAFEKDYLERGHAVHFRCRREDVSGLRIDLMSALRGVDPFEDLWSRRTTIEVEGEPVDLLSIGDLVRAKKTQRDKDWPMIRRLVEQSYFASTAGEDADIDFLLRELRTPDLLIEAVTNYSEEAARLAPSRPAIEAARKHDLDAVAAAIEEEEREERRKDREYWAPLKSELEKLRHA